MNAARRAAPPPQALETLLERIGATTFSGYVFDAADLSHRFVVTFLADGVTTDTAVADAFDARAAGDGCHGFVFQVPAESLADIVGVEVRVANLGTPVGTPLLLQDADVVQGASPESAHVRWLGGLRFTGALPAGHMMGVGEAGRILAIVDGETVAEIEPDRWQHNGLAGPDAKALLAFDVHLPSRFADGRVRRARFVEAGGRLLPGCPVAFVAFADGLAALIDADGAVESERLRGELYDRLVPMSVPLSDYARWRMRFPGPGATARQADPVAVVLVGSGDMDASLSSLEAQSHVDWVALDLPYRDAEQGFDCATLRAFLKTDAAACRVVVFLKAGLHLEAEALDCLAGALEADPHATLVYPDIAVIDAQDRAWPIAYPDFDYERMLEQGYFSTLFAVRRSDLDAVTGGKTLNLFRLANRLVPGPAAGAHVLHQPGCLGSVRDLGTLAATRGLASATAAHLKQRGVEAKVTLATTGLFPAVRVARRVLQPKVSIVIPVRNRVALLRRCLETIAPAVQRLAAEVIVVDNESSEPAMLDMLAGLATAKTQVLRVPGPFNFAKLNNVAAKTARGDYLCLLNNDVEAFDAFWLEELLSRIVEPDVGAVGALLVWPSGVVQHGGVVFSPAFGALHAFSDRLAEHHGYADMLLVAREASAVTAACLLTRRADYLDVGGLDEVLFPINFNDVDYCLKLRASGRRIVFTPHARLMHLESASRGNVRAEHRKGLFERELRSLRARWMEILVDDPLYNPMLSLDSVPFSGLAWPPRAMAVRSLRRWKAAEIPPGF